MSAPQLTDYIQGQGVVSGDQLNTFEQTCDNVAQLRALTGVTGLQVTVRGYSVPGDGGAGPFYWSPGAIGPDNGTTIIVPTGAALGAWLRLGYFSVSALFGSIYVSQLKQGLAIVDTANPPAVAGNIPASPYDPVNIGWTGTFVRTADALYTFVQNALGYTPTQMSAFFITCSGYPVSP